MLPSSALIQAFFLSCLPSLYHNAVIFKELIRRTLQSQLCHSKEHASRRGQERVCRLIRMCVSVFAHIFCSTFWARSRTDLFTIIMKQSEAFGGACEAIYPLSSSSPLPISSPPCSFLLPLHSPPTYSSQTNPYLCSYRGVLLPPLSLTIGLHRETREIERRNWKKFDGLEWIR